MRNSKSGFYGLPVEIISDPNDEKYVTTDSDLMFIDHKGMEWFVPRGYKTDGKSVPKIFWQIAGTPYAPDTLPAAIIHDWYCDKKVRSHKRTHQVWCEMLRHLPKVGMIRRKYLCLAVKWFGPKWDNK